MDAQAIRRIIVNLNNKLGRQQAAVEETEAQIEVFGDQLSVVENAAQVPAAVKSPASKK